MKTVLDWQPNYVEDHPDNVGLYFVTNLDGYVFVIN